jgi:hypothetical protein
MLPFWLVPCEALTPPYLNGLPQLVPEALPENNEIVSEKQSFGNQSIVSKTSILGIQLFFRVLEAFC